MSGKRLTGRPESTASPPSARAPTSRSTERRCSWSQAAKLNRTATTEGTTAGAIRLYKFSISYLTVLFAAVAIDALVLIRIG